MKRLSLTLALAAFALAANAQLLGRYGEQQLIIGGTNNVINLASNTYSAVIDCRDQLQVPIRISCSLIVSNFCKPRLDFMESVDGSTWTSTNFVQLTCLGGISTNDLCAGTACYATNVTVNGIGYLKLFRVANTDYHGIMTNVVVSYGIKK